MTQNSQYQRAEKIVEVIHTLVGFHPHHRALHAVGSVFRGHFLATSEAKGITRAVHLQGEPVPVTVRFSLGKGNPDGPTKQTVGMATKFYLADGRVTDLVMLNAPTFIVRTPDELVGLAAAIGPLNETGKPDMQALGVFLATHPATAAALQLRNSMLAPVSFASTHFHAVHAFRFVDEAGRATHAKYHWLPDAGVAEQLLEEFQQHADDHLFEDMKSRIAAAPVRYSLVLEIAEDGDPLDDPTQLWPSDRRRVIIGHLELTAATSAEAIGDPILLHDPTRIVDGIELTDDAIVQARRGTYELSAAQRTGGWQACPFGAIADKP